jgi:3-deoxy-manno-octulosonate cytidylyltransferase (CMP-KDO synthetase)
MTSDQVKVCAVIPARYASTRFPGKPLAKILGKPMIQHVYERVSRASLVDHVIIATDNRDIFVACKDFGAAVVITSESCANGTERVAEVVRRHALSNYCEFILNVQGDEPCIAPSTIDTLLHYVLEKKPLIATLATSIETWEDVQSPNVVKVVVNKYGHALYFSRNPVPFSRENISQHLRHYGVYVYESGTLLDYSLDHSTPLALSESLEQLKFLENGYLVHVVMTDHKSVGVDLPEHIAFAEEFLRRESC